jgi:hypothetical protein
MSTTGGGQPMPVWQVMLLEKIARGQNPQGLATLLANHDGIDPAEYLTFSARFTPATAIVMLALEQALNVRTLAGRGVKMVLESADPDGSMIDAAMKRAENAAKLLLDVSSYPIPMERVTTATDVRALTDAELLLKLKSMVRT